MNLLDAISKGRLETSESGGVLTITLDKSTLWFDSGQLVMIEDDNGKIVQFGTGDQLVSES